MFDKISYYDEKKHMIHLALKNSYAIDSITKECLFQEGDLSNII